MKNLTTFPLIFLIVALIIIPYVSATPTGGTITTSGSWIIHTFNTSGDFNITENDTGISYEVLIVAGGGAGAGSRGAGGGGGGVYYNTSFNISTSVRITVGNGGAAGGTSMSAANGSNSSIGTIFQAKGGGGMHLNDYGYAGGSGGGSADNNTPGSGLTGQGHNGGKGILAPDYGAGGGGGADQPGEDGTISKGGDGGNGSCYTISGSLECYGGGGGGGSYGTATGGAGGNGGGGAGGLDGANNPGSPGTDGTGGGGGGGHYETSAPAGSKGGNGIVIIRYATPLNSTINYNSNTTNAGTYFNESKNSIYGSVFITNLEGHSSTTINIYNSTNLYASETSATDLNLSYNFTGLPPNNYYLNATATNGSFTISTTARAITIYGLRTNITQANNTAYDRILNLSYNYTAIPTGAVTISGNNISLMNPDGSLNLTLNSSTNTTPYIYDTYGINLSTGIYKIRIETTDSTGNKSTDTKNINITKNAQLNISARYTNTNAIISNFTINITDESTGLTETYTTTSNKTSSNIIKDHNYTIIIDAPGYALTNITGISFNRTFNQYNFSIYTTNSVLITIYDEATLNIINTSTVSITFTNNITSLVYSTNNGTYYKDGLADGTWEVKFYSANYSYRTYFITVNNRSFQTLNAYLVPSTYTAVFTIRNSLTLTSIEGATFITERLNNASWVIVESKLTDISGNVQIGFLPGIEYRFTISKTGYTSKVFTLNPIIFNSYNVYIDPIASLNNTFDYGLVNIIYYPKTFYNNRQNNLTFTITSPDGVLSNYGIRVTAPGGNNHSEGNNAIGESFTIRFNITNATFFDRVNISFNYTSTISGIHTYSFQYEIIGVNNIGNNTIANLKNKEYGMGTFEKVLLVMIATCIIAGLSYALVGLGGSLLMGLLSLNVGVYLGFLPFWSVIITDILAVVIIVAVSVSNR